MNNPNPFVPQGSLLDQQSKRQSRMKLAVFCVLAISVTGLMAMLIQGCKRNAGTGTEGTADNSGTSAVDTNTPAATLEPTNGVAEGSNNFAALPYSTNMAPPPMPAPTPATVPTPMPAPVPPVVDNGAATSGAEYTVIHGDTFAKIAKKSGVSVKALENANPTVQPTKLKVGQKLTIPAGGKAMADGTSGAGLTAGGATAEVSGETYVVKAGDTLTKIARAHGTTVKAIEAANNLTTTKISVGKKLKIPVKAEAPAPAPVDTAPAAPVTAPAAPISTPTLPPVTPPAPAPVTPAPAH